MKRTLPFLGTLVTGALVVAMAIPAAAQSSLLKTSAPDCNYGGLIKSIEATDASTVKFTFCKPNPAFPSIAAFSAFDIHQEAQLTKDGGGGDDLLSNPIGTGPYKLSKWDHGNEIDLVANENYRGTPAKVKNVVIKFNGDASKRWQELQAGSVDGIEYPDTADYAAIQANADFKLYPVPPTNILYLGINNTVKPFDNPKVRQAIAYAIDKKRLIDNFFPAGSTVAEQFMPPLIFGYTKDSKTNEFDLAKAKQLLADSGVTLPITATLSYRDKSRPYFPQPGPITQDIQAQLAAIGINVTVNVMESTAFLDAAQAGKLQLTMLGWGADYPDATDFLDYHFNNAAEQQFGTLDKDLDAILSKAAALSDPAARLALYKQANDRIADQVPMVPLANGANAQAFKAAVTGAYGNPFSAIQLALLDNPGASQLVWEQAGEPGSLYCNDETDGEALEVCEQINEALLMYKPGTGDVIAGLADLPTANSDATEYTFKIAAGAKWSDGTPVTANDVVATWTAVWDASSPNHKGRTGTFDYFSAFFGGFLNPPPAPTKAS